MMHTLLMTKKLPHYILDHFGNYCELLKHITILDDSIAEGLVYKISIEGNLNDDGFEIGFLYLTAGSSIKKPRHINESERYILGSGKLSVDGKSMIENECEVGEFHNIDRVPVDTLICTYKQKEKVKKLLPSTYFANKGMI